MDKAQAISVKELLHNIGYIDGKLTVVSCAGCGHAREELQQARVMVREMMERVESGIADPPRPPIPADAACDVHTVTHPRTDNPRPERTMYPSLPSGVVKVTHATRPSPEAKSFYAHFDGMAWPMANEAIGDIESALRYDEPAGSDLMIAASVLSAYRELVHCPRVKREMVVRRLREAEGLP